jgi:hypothetical protein
MTVKRFGLFPNLEYLRRKLSKKSPLIFKLIQFSRFGFDINLVFDGRLSYHPSMYQKNRGFPLEKSGE